MSRWLPPSLLVLLLLVSYGRLTTMQGVVITDDVFTSDVMNAEFPWRVAAGRMVRSGELPLWSPDMCGGYPLLAGGGGTEPVALALFTLLPPRVAINLLMLLILAGAALGTYAYARAIGASRAGAALAGLAFSYSGFMVCQLKHLGAATCVGWFPLALLFLERSLRSPSSRPGPPPDKEALPLPDPGRELTAGEPTLAARLPALAGFALVFGLQILTGFPQSVYIAGLAYGTYALLRLPWLAWHRLPWRSLLARYGSLGIACLVGVGLGAVQLAPQLELSELSQRVRLNVDQAAHVAFWPRNLWMFLSPYINGDISNLTYRGPSVFWEDYGYVGLLPLLLGAVAIYAGLVRGFLRWHVVAWFLVAGLALLMVVSKATPVFALAHKHLPGMNVFRFPTRFMFVVDFGLAVLGGLGLTRLQQLAAGRGPRKPGRRKLAWLAWPVVAVAAIDLLYHQPRQNAIADAGRWFREPATVQAIRRLGTGLFRVYSLGALESHQRAFHQARGWTDLEPYLRQRDYLQVNTNLLWGLSSPDCYTGLVPRWSRDFFGPLGLITRADLRRPGLLGGRAVFLRLLELWNVRYLIVPRAVELRPELRLVGGGHDTSVYELRDTLPRAFIAAGALVARDRAEAQARLIDPDFDPRQRVVLDGELPGAAPPALLAQPAAAPRRPAPGAARIVSFRASEVLVRTSHPSGGFLVLADTWFPGWRAELDGERELPVLRANLAQKAVQIPAGEHTVRFVFRSSRARLGGLVTLASLACLGLLGLLLPRRLRRSAASQ